MKTLAGLRNGKRQQIPLEATLTQFVLLSPYSDMSTDGGGGFSPSASKDTPRRVSHTQAPTLSRTPALTLTKTSQSKSSGKEGDDSDASDLSELELPTVSTKATRIVSYISINFHVSQRLERFN